MGVRAKHVFRWDLDKTYLRTEFDSVRDLLNSALEKASDKRAYPGAAALLRSLRQTGDHRICIVSGSPSQMRAVLTAKLAFDGIEFDEFVLKNNLHNIMRFRFRALRSQVPFKLAALLESRAGIIGDAKETLFGDDSEADGVIYSLFGDILAGVVDEEELRASLEAAEAYPDQIKRTMALAEHLRGSGDSVQRILIHLEKRSPTESFEHFGQRLVPVYNYLQAALVMYEDDLIDCQQLLFVMQDMLNSNEYDLHSLSNSMQDLMRRGRMSTNAASGLALDLQAAAAGAATPERAEHIEHISWTFAERVKELNETNPTKWPKENPRLDYEKLIAAEYSRKRSDAR
ncbi:MAG: hypothetical protein GY811_10365 [Myxococcales bacterium]|nr:hypothetical protein [Myxococcales bacterium]